MTPAQVAHIMAPDLFPLLCQAWGESDRPCAFIAYTETEVRKFIVNEWWGDDTDERVDEVMSDLRKHDWKDEPEWHAEFEIGGVSFKPIYESNSRAAVEAALRDAPQQAEPQQSEGWKPMLVEIASWNNLIDAMDRAERKGYLPDAVVDEWLQFDYKELPGPSLPPSAPTAVEPPYPMATTLEGAAQDVSKWLNERPNSPLDLRHVAMLVHAVQTLPTAVEPDGRAKNKPKREPWICLQCLSDRPGHHRTLDDKVTPCPNGAKGTPL